MNLMFLVTQSRNILEWVRYREDILKVFIDPSLLVPLMYRYIKIIKPKFTIDNFYYRSCGRTTATAATGETIEIKNLFKFFKIIWIQQAVVAGGPGGVGAVAAQQQQQV